LSVEEPDVVLFTALGTIQHLVPMKIDAAWSHISEMITFDVSSESLQVDSFTYGWWEESLEKLINCDYWDDHRLSKRATTQSL
jgi:hypothetical protein